ncbi:hypothetical protein BJ170DRAFT_594745 [Xylariales sp. AK1849]|nr:hypothetical protein BJ170DRAFT_594745 [Xylariales sp. AK1849]
MAAQTPSKGMSSRLLTMKFMQRAAATSSPASNPPTPNTDESSSKRRKVAHSRSGNLDVDSLVDQRAIQAAIDEGERKREEALVKHATELGDARWVLNVQEDMPGSANPVQKPLQVVQVGYAQIDSPDTSADYRAAEASDSDSDDSSSNNSDSFDASSSADEQGHRHRTPAMKQGNSLPKNGYSSKRSAELAKAKELAEKRRKKDVKLNTANPHSLTGGLSSISSGGGLTSLSLGGRSVMQPKSVASSSKCHNCGEPGHFASSCKKPKQRYR